MLRKVSEPEKLFEVVNVGQENLRAINQIETLANSDEIKEFIGVLDSLEDGKLNECRQILKDMKFQFLFANKSIAKYGTLSKVVMHGKEVESAYKEEPIHETIGYWYPRSEGAGESLYAEMMPGVVTYDIEEKNLEISIDKNNVKNNKNIYACFDKEDSKLNFLMFKGTTWLKASGLKYVSLQRLENGQFKLEYLTEKKEHIILFNPKEVDKAQKFVRSLTKPSYRKPITGTGLLKGIANLRNRYDIDHNGHVRQVN